jgi:hypothetical protein
MSRQKSIAFAGCSWCDGHGCNQCFYEREKYEAKIEANLKTPQPIFTADLNNPGDMQLLKDFFGKDALEHAFGPDGNGTEEINLNAAMASLTQELRNHNSKLI